MPRRRCGPGPRRGSGRAARPAPCGRARRRAPSLRPLAGADARGARLARSSRRCWCSRVRWRGDVRRRSAREPCQHAGALDDRACGPGARAAPWAAAQRAAGRGAVDRHRRLGRVGRRRAGDRGDVVEQRAVGVVADGGDDRDGQERDGAAERLVAEAKRSASEPPPRATTTRRPPEGREVLQRARDRGAAWRSCTGANAHTTRPPQPRRRRPASTSSRALPPSPVTTPIMRGSAGAGGAAAARKPLGVQRAPQPVELGEQVALAGQPQAETENENCGEAVREPG